MSVRPLYNQRALYVPEQHLAILADLHLGLEYDLSLRGAQIPVQSGALIDAACAILEETSAERLLIAGDLKHIIRPRGDSQEYRRALRQERQDVALFIKRVADLADITLVIGNHDGGIQHFGGLSVSPAAGITLTPEHSCIHGHAWPAAEVMRAKTLIMGHVHPVVHLHSPQGYASSQTCWVRAPLNVQAAQEVYPDVNVDMEIIIMPAFNSLCGGTPVNVDGLLGPLHRITDLSQAHAYLPDSTYLGVVGDL
jgi:putative SbcD/Mre11-related phosphoesterase